MSLRLAGALVSAWREGLSTDLSVLARMVPGSPLHRAATGPIALRSFGPQLMVFLLRVTVPSRRGTACRAPFIASHPPMQRAGGRPVRLGAFSGTKFVSGLTDDLRAPRSGSVLINS